MKIRTIKPEFWSSTTIARLSRDARLFFIGLWCAADNGGRMLGSPKQLAGLLYPHDEDVGGADISRWLTELEGLGLVQRYTADGRALLQVVGFSEHQKVDARWPSRLPPPAHAEDSRELSERSPNSRENSPSPRPTLAECSPEPREDSACTRPTLAGTQPLRNGIENLELRVGVSAPSAPHTHTEGAAEPPSPEETPESRAYLAERAKVVADGRRQRAEHKAASQAILGRPRSAEALLAMAVTVLSDGRVSACDQDHPGARPLRDVWRERYPQFDGRGTPRRRSLEEFVDALWSSSMTHVWDGTGSAYLARWATWLGADAEKIRRAWEQDGGANAADPERAAAKRRWLEKKARGDVPPFETWFVESWKRGHDHADVDDADLPDFDAPAPPRTGPPLGRGSGRPTPPPTHAKPPTYDDAPEAKAAADAAFAAMRAATSHAKGTL